jgi:hypothetical protein
MRPVKINDTTYEVTLPAGDRVKIGEKEAVDFKPHLRLNRWDGECFVKVGLATMSQGSPVVEGEKVRWVEPELEACFYPLEPVTVGGFSRNELGGFEFEITLKKKPAKNTVELDIETKGLKFYYQPPLTPEEVAEGAVRPDSVVGSYAAYHANKTSVHRSKADAERYKCGKAFHIYRPKIIDANGDWVWAELNIDEPNGKLIITVDQDWLNKAIYPVVVDPTFGYESVGSSTASLSHWGPYRCLYTMGGSDGTGDSITAYFQEDTGNDTKYKFAVYSGNNVISNGVTEEGTVLANGQGWYTRDFLTSPALTASADYWLAAACEKYGSGASVYFKYYYDTGDTDQAARDTTNYEDVFPDPWSNDNTYARKFSIYCTYTEGGGATEKQSSDTGAGAELLVGRDIALPDTGAGVDSFVSLQTPAAKTSSDTGAGVDALVSLQAPVARTASDAGSGVEAFIARLLAVAEAGYGAEVSKIGGGGLLKHLFAGELGKGADGLTAKIEMPTKGGGMRLWT